MISKMGRENFEAYFSFAVVRNPWDWQASLYTFILKEINHYQHRLVKGFRDFDEYIEWRCSHEVMYQKDFMFDQKGVQLVDFVARFENLEADFQHICTRLGISATLPRLNVSKTRPYQEFYSEKSAALVRETFAPDIELFGYEFSGNGKHTVFSDAKESLLAS